MDTKKGVSDARCCTKCHKLSPIHAADISSSWLLYHRAAALAVKWSANKRKKNTVRVSEVENHHKQGTRRKACTRSRREIEGIGHQRSTIALLLLQPAATSKTAAWCNAGLSLWCDIMQYHANVMQTSMGRSLAAGHNRMRQTINSTVTNMVRFWL